MCSISLSLFLIIGGSLLVSASQLAALRSWSAFISDVTSHPQFEPQVSSQLILDHYATKLSEIYGHSGATVNLVLVGACDGTHDSLILKQFLPNPHWFGIFLEPVAVNFQDLMNFLIENKAQHRSLPLRAAIMDVCDKQVIDIKVPSIGPNDPQAPHWLRREIGSVITDNTDRSDINNAMWRIEEVPCRTAEDIFKEWHRLSSAASEHSNNDSNHNASSANSSKRRRRVHILKIDAEGLDSRILLGFIGPAVADRDLPLLLMFESKMLSDFSSIMLIATNRGYTLLRGNTSDDTFAYLRPQVLFG